MKKIFFTHFIFVTSFLFAQEKDQVLSKQTQTELLRPLTVTVGGNFIVTGSFTSYASQRVDHFVSQLFLEARKQATSSINQFDILKKINEEISKFPLRDIILKRFNGEEVKIDLLRFRLTGDFKFNPYLQNDDVLIFPAFDEKTNFVSVTGAVNNPITFQFVEGDKLSDAILFAGGINKLYENVNEAEVSRLTDKGSKEEILRVKINDDFFLQRGDRIRILFDENNKRDFKVLVIGEVNKPGFIPITKGSTSIKELMIKAGGFTDKAWLQRSEILKGTSQLQMLKMKTLREDFEKSEKLNLILSEKYLNEIFLEQTKMLRMNDLYAQDSLVVIIDNLLRLLQKNSAVDFTKIFSDTTDDGKYIVDDGDIVVVPQKEELVYVFGQVKRPGFVPYQKEKQHDYYINKAGGFGERAIDDEVKIIKGNSYAWITADHKTKIDSGDFIYVPKDVPKPFAYYMREVGAASSIITAIATIILIVVQARR
ncbi:MAG: SLBB domain-containing protein [Bacteroidota bacterium]